MRRSLLAAVIVALTSSQAVQAQDLTYRYKSAEVASLKGYNGQPYWRVLAECAGAHGALSNRYQAAGQAELAEAAKARGVSFLLRANEQLRTDRGIAGPAARMLTDEAVDAGRASGAAALSERTASGYRYEQLLDLLCTQVLERHAQALRFAR